MSRKGDPGPAKQHASDAKDHASNGGYKTRKTNDIWLLGGKSKSGTLNSADGLWGVI